MIVTNSFLCKIRDKYILIYIYLVIFWTLELYFYDNYLIFQAVSIYTYVIYSFIKFIVINRSHSSLNLSSNACCQLLGIQTSSYAHAQKIGKPNNFSLSEQAKMIVNNSWGSVW